MSTKCRLLGYLDDEDHLSVPAAERVVSYADVLLAVRLSFQQVNAEWPDWFPLVDGFTRSYDGWDLNEMFEEAPLGGPGGNSR